MDRKKLEMLIERQIHALISEVKEHVVDFTVLTIRKRHPEIDRAQLSKILEIVQQGIDDGFMTKIDRFMGRLDTSLTEYAGEADPLDVPAEKRTKKSA